RLNEGDNIAAGNIRGHRLEALGPFVQHLVTPSGLVNIGDLSQENESAALAAKGQASHFCNVVSARTIEDCNDIEDLVTLIRLSDNLALIGRADQLEHFDGTEAPALKVGFAQADGELREAGWRLDLNFGGAWYLAERDGDFPRLLIENVEIVAEDTNNNRCGIARKRLLDALREKSLEREVHTDECCKSAPDLCFSGFRLVAAQWLEIDL